MDRREVGLPSRVRDRLEEALRRTFFARRDPAFLESEAGRSALEDHVATRYDVCARHVVPWVQRHVDLTRADLIEVGCGTGSTAAAFAPHVGRIRAYDMAPTSIEAARERVRILGIENVEFTFARPESLLDAVDRDHPEGADAFLLYAVLEHQKLDERLETLERAWGLLRPGGVLIVGDTPNRLVYLHRHTSHVPFFDMLPGPLQMVYTQRSPIPLFRDKMREAIDASADVATDRLDRWGRGVSFHEFEAVLGDLRSLVIADGFAPEIVARKRILRQERLLLSFMVEEQLPVPLGFARESLDIVLRKPVPGQDPPEPPAPPEGVELVAAEELKACEERLARAEDQLHRRRESHERLSEEHARLLEELRALDAKRR